MQLFAFTILNICLIYYRVFKGFIGITVMKKIEFFTDRYLFKYKGKFEFLSKKWKLSNRRWADDPRLDRLTFVLSCHQNLLSLVSIHPL